MTFKIRYRFWKVLSVLVGMGILITILTLIARSMITEKEILEALTKPRSTVRSKYISYIAGFVYAILLFYFASNYFYNLVASNKKFISYLKASVLMILACFTYYTFLLYCFPQALQKEYSSLLRLLISVLPNALCILFISYGVAYITILQEGLKQRKILEAEKIQLETQISQANFNFLKAQINPHFLHNTLNFLYAKSLPYSEELSEGILTLSDIMRYALSKGNQKDGKAPLHDEIEHLRNVIKISQLRYSNLLKVNFEVSGEVNGTVIIPFVLITLVENAFMHGELKNPEYPIDIKLDVKGNKLYFYCSNKKRSGSKQLSTGIGLDNIKKRLDLAYGNNYKFIVKDESEFYTTELNIEKL